MGFGNSDLTGVTSLWDTIRWLFSVLDRPVYGLLSLVYQLFFNVASSEILSGKMVAKFYGRIQLIIGVFMMFQLAMVIIKGIMNPDSFTDKKTGAGNVITRIMVSLFMLTLIVPINIPNASNEYERKISSNGLLFGTLYSLQYRILNNNTIGKLVLGVKGDNRNYAKTGNMDDLERSANRFTSTILRVFYRVNTVPKSVIDNDSDYAECRNLDDPAAKSKCRVCDDTDSGKLIKTYAEDAADPQDILHMVNESCNGSFMNSVGKVINLIPFVKVDNKERYVFVFTPLLSTVVGIAMIFIFLSFTIDVAVRAIKIAVLRLIAPIPIISYMDPNGSKDSAFNAWVKTLSTTYLSLFLRLAIVYFVLFVIEGLMENGITMNKSTGMLGGFTTICIFIGLFVFAKQAPKFIKEALGIKDAGGKFFSGLSEAMGVGAAFVGGIGSTVAGYRASKMADETRQNLGYKVNPRSPFNVGKHLLSGAAGGIGGTVAGIGATMSAKDHALKASIDATRKRNATALARGNDGSTLLGRARSSLGSTFLGEGAAGSIEREITTNKSRIDALKAIQSRVKGEMVKKDWTRSVVGKQDANGNWTYFMRDVNNNFVDGGINYKDFMAKKNAAASAGLTQFQIDTTNGVRTISMSDANYYEGLIMKGNENDYIQQQILDPGQRRQGVDNDSRFTTLVHNATVLGGSAEFEKDANGNITKKGNKAITDRASIWEVIESYEDYNVQLGQRNALNKANDQYSGNKK